MKIALACDHAEYRYKKRIKDHLAGLGQEIEDFGTRSEDPVDYPFFILPAARAVG